MLFRPFTAVTYIVLMLLAGCAEPGGGNPTNVEDCREITRLRKHDVLTFSATPIVQLGNPPNNKTGLVGLKISIVVLTPGDTARPMLTVGSTSFFDTTANSQVKMPLLTMVIPRKYIVHRSGSRHGVLSAALFMDVDGNDSCDTADKILAISQSVLVVSDIDETCTSPRTWWEWLQRDTSGVVVSEVYRQDASNGFFLTLQMTVDEKEIIVPAPWIYPAGSVLVLQQGRMTVRMR